MAGIAALRGSCLAGCYGLHHKITGAGMAFETVITVYGDCRYGALTVTVPAWQGIQIYPAVGCIGMLEIAVAGFTVHSGRACTLGGIYGIDNSCIRAGMTGGTLRM